MRMHTMRQVKGGKVRPYQRARPRAAYKDNAFCTYDTHAGPREEPSSRATNAYGWTRARVTSGVTPGRYSRRKIDLDSGLDRTCILNKTYTLHTL